MGEFTIHIDTMPGTCRSEEFLDQVADALQETEASDPVVSLDTLTGVLGGTFQVEADDISNAGKLGVDAFKHALHAAGIHGSSGTFRVKPIQRFGGRSLTS